MEDSLRIVGIESKYSAFRVKFKLEWRKKLKVKN
jgi:hypothetical protein